MYKNHQPLIAKHAQTPEGFTDVGLFCILSARTRFSNLNEQFQRIKSGDLQPLYGWKRDAYLQHKEQANHRLNKLNTLNNYAYEWTLLDEVSNWPGFSLIKGGFFLQLVYGVSGCIDSRNMKSLGIAREMLELSNRLTIPSKRKRVYEYSRLVKTLGGTEFLWDKWCSEYAESGDGPWTTPYEVSAEHCKTLGIG
jgi:hypothetical protein